MIRVLVENEMNLQLFSISTVNLGLEGCRNDKKLGSIRREPNLVHLSKQNMSPESPKYDGCDERSSSQKVPNS